MFTKVKYNIFYLWFMYSDRKLKQKQKNKIAQRFLEFNNKRVMKNIKNKKNILVLLPHCLQKYDCPYKVTAFIENCKKCYKCVIADFIDIKEQYGVDVKIATGGTLARKYVKELKIDLVIAVACKRDLVSGIYDAYPVDVIGVFNEIVGEPCINTNVAIDKIKNILNRINGGEKI